MEDDAGNNATSHASKPVATNEVVQKQRIKPKPTPKPKPKQHVLLQSFPQIPRNHITVGLSNLLAQTKQHETLFRHRRLPDHGWSDLQIQSLLLTLSTLDTNHAAPVSHGNLYRDDDEEGSVGGGGERRWCGVGEREGRVYSTLVSNRHFGLSHGVGRSGDVTEPQPKAVGSSVIAELTRCLVLDAMRRGSGLDGSKPPGGKKKKKKEKKNGEEDNKEETNGENGEGNDGWEGGGPVRFGIVLPLCTGMSMSLVLASLRESATVRDLERDRRRRKEEGVADTDTYPAPGGNTRDIVLWSRIDQKSCFKAILSAGLTPIPVPTLLDPTSPDQVITDLSALSALLTTYADRTLAVISTTSCFAPRAPDSVDEIARLCKERGVPHVVNNAYGLQCEGTCRLINRACVVGRVDAMVCSTDKNFLVPVGGAVVTSPSQNIIQSVGKVYAGRASSAPVLDLLITLLSMGLNGYRRLLERRKALVVRFRNRLEQVATEYGERVLSCPRNTISFGVTLDTLAADVAAAPPEGGGAQDVDRARDEKAEATSLFGSMLFTRCVSGTRVVPRYRSKTIGGLTFEGFGSSTDGYPHAYLTAACAVGLAGEEMEEFFDRLDGCFKDFFVKRRKEAKRVKG